MHLYTNISWFIFCLQPEKVEFELKLGQSKPIYNAFKAIRESPDWERLSDAQKRVVECKYYPDLGTSLKACLRLLKC